MTALRSAVAAENWSEATADLLDEVPAEEIALAIPKTAADERTLRIVLQNQLAKRWPSNTNEYQTTCMHFAASDVRGGKRAYASNLGVRGTFNDEVLAVHIQHTDEKMRIAAGQLTRARHLPLLEEQTTQESDEGVSLRTTDGAVLVVRASKLVGECDPNSLLRFQHPAAEPEWQGEEPHWQRNRPVYNVADLQGLAEKDPVEHKLWSTRTKKLGYKPVRERRAVQQTWRAIGCVTIRHSTYGHGYGGKIPVKFDSISTISPSPVTTSEIVWDARRIMGVDAMKPKKGAFV